MTEEDDEDLNPRELKSKHKQEWSEAVQKWAEDGIIKNKVYLGKTDAYKSWLYILDTGDGAKAALEYVAIDSEKDDNWVEEVARNPVHKDIMQSVLKYTEKHPVMVSMKSNQLMEVSDKRAIKTSRSAQSWLNTLSRNVNIDRRLTQLEEGLAQTQSRVEVLEDTLSELVTHVGDTKELQEDLKSNSKMLTKELALSLAKKGFTQAEIASKVGKSQATINRWLKEV